MLPQIHRRRRSARLAPLWLALCVYALGMLAAHWHAATQSHEVCEHGDVVHAKLGPAHADHAGGPDPAWSSGGAHGEVEAHGHCGLWSPSLRPALDTRATLEARPAVELVRAPARELTRPEAAFALYLLAPGRSPPEA